MLGFAQVILGGQVESVISWHPSPRRSTELLKFYQGEFEAGRAIVTVNAAGRADEAAAVLRRNGAYDMSSRAAEPVAK